MQSNTYMMGGAVIVAVAIGGAILLRPLPEPVDVAQSPPVTPVRPDVVVEAAPERHADPVGPADPISAVNTGETVAIVDPIDPVAAAPAPGETDPVAPLLLTGFRFEPDGGFLVFGKTTPDQPVAAVVDGTEVERISASSDGSFILTGFVGHSDTPRSLTVIGDPDGAGISADRRFIMAANPAPVVVATAEGAAEGAAVQDAPVAQIDDVAVAVVPETTIENPSDVAVLGDTQPAAPLPSDPLSSDIPDVLTEAQTRAEPPAIPSTPAILAVTADGVDVVQAPVAENTPPEAMSTVALDTITYDPSGDVVLQGRATGEGVVQVYVNNTPVSQLPIDVDGNWRGDLPDVDTGVYTLRIDEVDPAGEVVSRIETPFLREAPEDVIAAMADNVDTPNFTVATRTVQPGATLWAIAEERYGAGVLYVTVFEANRDRIRDPDLIYPGQVFMLPEDAN
ncbi:MAG: LysM peptidoglycan-binding domain-containing protein [Yoonia sp.]|uniref:LysM peptidoglycan-binding domain-containing protein n=1 Tax=Yoonia sp. TaxID=2212373 RepID=UPI003EF9903D